MSTLACMLFVAAAAQAEAAPDEAVPAVMEAEKENEDAESAKWEFSASLYGYFVRDDTDYAALTLMADRGWLHLEARYQYEDLNTVSLFLGYNFAFGETWSLELTPMVGLVSGDTDAIAPAYELTLGFRRLALYTEGEYVFDQNDSDYNYFYSWSELTYSPTDWLYFGLAAQRLKTRDEDEQEERRRKEMNSPRDWLIRGIAGLRADDEDDEDVALGPMVGVTFGHVGLSVYWFEPGDDDQTIATALTVKF